MSLTNIFKGDMNDCSNAFNKNPIHDVQCPLSCWEFMDNDFNLMPFSHALKLYFPHFNQFSCDTAMLRGAKPWWLESEGFFHWSIDPEKGSSWAACKSHGPPSSQYIHAKERTDFNNSGIWEPSNGDPAAVMKFSTQVMMARRTEKENVSYHAAKQWDSRSAISTITFARVILSQISTLVQKYASTLN